MGERARRHHLVSKFYLRHFADDHERVATVELPGREPFVQSIGDASVRTDYFTVIDQQGDPSDMLEQAFGQIEADAAAAWKAVLDGEWPLASPRREHMALWIAVHLLRTDSTRTSINQVGSTLMQLQAAMGGRGRVRDFLRETGKLHDEASVDEFWIDLFRNPPSLEVTANEHAKHLANALPTAATNVMERLWVLTVFRRKGLATSDHPVMVVPNPELAAVGMGTGIVNAHEIAVPLTRRHHLGLAARQGPHGDLSGIDDITQPGTGQIALYCNSVTSMHARRFLYHHPDDTPLNGLELPEPRIREIGDINNGPWNFMSDEDRQVLIDAGLTDPREALDSGG